jgi:hypothetical protein
MRSVDLPFKTLAQRIQWRTRRNLCPGQPIGLHSGCPPDQPFIMPIAFKRVYSLLAPFQWATIGQPSLTVRRALLCFRNRLNRGTEQRSFQAAESAEFSALVDISLACYRCPQ